MEILSMNVVVSAIVDPWVTTLSFVVALAMRIQGSKIRSKAEFCPNGAAEQCSTVPTMPKCAQNGAQVVKNAFSWGFHFSAYNVCPDKNFLRGKKSS